MRAINTTLTFVFVVSLGASTALAQAPQPSGGMQRFVLKWTWGSLPIEVRTARAPIAWLQREAENGLVSDDVVLPIQSELPNGVIELGPKEDAAIYIFVRNLSKKLLKFSVSPHSTHPGASALGFYFGCLCNGHIYEAPAGRIWYRVMRLRRKGVPLTEKEIVLDHMIFSPKPGHSPH